jgi:hypothetical protein
VENVAASERSIPAKTEPVKLSDVVTLKPSLWGMSIDLLKAGNWLRNKLRNARGQ